MAVRLGSALLKGRYSSAERRVPQAKIANLFLSAKKMHAIDQSLEEFGQVLAGTLVG